MIIGTSVRFLADAAFRQENRHRNRCSAAVACFIWNSGLRFALVGLPVCYDSVTNAFPGLSLRQHRANASADSDGSFSPDSLDDLCGIALIENGRIYERPSQTNYGGLSRMEMKQRKDYPPVVAPPSTISVVPVMKAAASVARYSIADAISSGCAIRCMGILSSRDSARALSSSRP